MTNIDLNQFIAAHSAGAFVLDVREAAEYRQAHVPGAVWIPLGQLPMRKAEVAGRGLVHVVCRSGGRSKVGAEVLNAAGIDAVTVDGGTDAWTARGLPVVTGANPA